MKVLEYRQKGLKENRVEVYYDQMDPQIQEILQFVNEWQQILGKEGNDTVVISPQEIYYFEAVDKRCFVYLKQKVYQVNNTLQELEGKLERSGFVRINKSMIVNLKKVKRLQAGLNMRMTAELLNGEQLVINRSYKAVVNEKIKELYRGRSNADH